MVFPSLVPQAAFFPTEHLQTDTWLDASTYLPVRIRTIRNGHLLDNEYDTWLPRTVRNLGKTHVVIPSGFRHAQPSNTGANGSTFVTSESIRISAKTSAPMCHAP